MARNGCFRDVLRKWGIWWRLYYLWLLRPAPKMHHLMYCPPLTKPCTQEDLASFKTTAQVHIQQRAALVWHTTRKFRYETKNAIPLNRPVARFWGLGGQNTFLGGKDFCLCYMFKTNFSSNNKNWGAQKQLGGTALNAPQRLRACRCMCCTDEPQQIDLLPQGSMNCTVLLRVDQCQPPQSIINFTYQPVLLLHRWSQRI